MEPITYIDRLSGQKMQEKVYGEKAIRLLYGDDLMSQILGTPLLQLSAKFPFFSALYGWWQSRAMSKKKIGPFVDNFDIDAGEFAKGLDQFSSFNDFFVRKLKPEARPIARGHDRIVIPADGRFYFYPHIDQVDGFVVKDRKFKFDSLLRNPSLAERYAKGSMMIGRLCPSDYHRFHFPCDGIPGDSEWINGWLYSVNPIALKRNIDIFTRNKRCLTHLETDRFGTILYVEIGATNVGSIVQTFTPHQQVAKGDEKGYFSFGASALILLFEPDRIIFDRDLVEATEKGFEMRCLLGQSMGLLSASQL